tara:strand:- start:270 stop:1508 length:1239 start_codon:yes stop_codon:yes gene_type:complete
MIFFQNIRNMFGLQSSIGVFANSTGNLSIFQKLLFFHDQGIFSFLFIGSFLLHVMIGLIFGMISEFLKPEVPPIRAKIGVRYLEPPAKLTPVFNSKKEIHKPILQNIESKPIEKLTTPEPKQPVLKKPILKDSIKNSVLSKPALPQPEAPRLKIPKTNKIPLLSEGKKPDFKKTKLTNFPKKPPLSTPDLPTSIPKLPKVKNNPALLNPLTSKKSNLSPSQLDLPKIEVKNMQPKKLSNPEFSKPKDPEFEKLLKILTPSSSEVLGIKSVQPEEKPKSLLGEILGNQVKIDEDHPEIGVFEQTQDQTLNQIPNMSFLQRKKLAQLAGQEYNLHIRTRIKPKFGSSSPNLFVRILLKINESGQIVYHEIKESSGSKAFDKAAELAVRNAVLDPLPTALAENPPYIVVIKLRQN